VTRPPATTGRPGPIEHESKDGLELNPTSIAQPFYLARRAEGLGDMETPLATRACDRWVGAPRFRPSLTAAEVLGLRE
jgi:hypothetical protein